MKTIKTINKIKTIKKILIIADHMENNVSNFIKEMINCALEINKLIPVSIYTLLIGKNLNDQVEFLSQRGIHVTFIELTTHNFEINASILDIAWKLINPFAQKLKPDIIITGHNSFGTALLPQLAINMNASCITGVKKITENNGKLIYTRFLYNGKFESNVCSERNITAISILPGIFTSNDLNIKKTGEINHIKKIDIENVPITLKKISKPFISNSSFDNADVIVAMGQGIGENENIEKIKEFSKIFQQSTIAGSRPMIDKGWLPYKYQVGITGKTVAPIIYIACGISGSSQHVAGMGSSEYIIAINSDPNAAIFNISDLCIVDDIISFINIVIENVTI